MPRYFFSCHGAQTFDDKIGTELPDLMSAKVQAFENAGEIFKDHAERFAEDPRWRMMISDEGGEVLYSVVMEVGPPSGPHRDLS